MANLSSCNPGSIGYVHAQYMYNTWIELVYVVTKKVMWLLNTMDLWLAQRRWYGLHVCTHYSHGEILLPCMCSCMCSSVLCCYVFVIRNTFLPYGTKLPRNKIFVNRPKGKISRKICLWNAMPSCRCLGNVKFHRKFFCKCHPIHEKFAKILLRKSFALDGSFSSIKNCHQYPLYWFLFRILWCQNAINT